MFTCDWTSERPGSVPQRPHRAAWRHENRSKTEPTRVELRMTRARRDAPLVPRLPKPRRRKADGQCMQGLRLQTGIKNAQPIRQGRTRARTPAHGEKTWPELVLGTTSDGLLEVSLSRPAQMFASEDIGDRGRQLLLPLRWN